VIAHGNGRSYGDVCLNGGGTVLLTRQLDKFIDFDRTTGRLTCEAGVLLDDILALSVSDGWFLPVTPGTRFVTVGGAIANDVHGKNHHVAGCFGHHVQRLCLRRSDGTDIICSPTHQTDWLHATIGGLGLTGLIVWAEVQLVRIPGEWMQTQVLRFETVDEFLHLSTETDATWPYAAAWIDCSSVRGERVRGVLLCGKHVDEQPPRVTPPGRGWRLPIEPPLSLINALTVRGFNGLYWRRQGRAAKGSLRHYIPFLYPLDHVLEWNRIYGPRGFLQHQCVLPPGDAKPAVEALLTRIAASGQGSFLSVLKRFGDMRPAGMLSFARPGITLALDFPMRGPSTLRLLDELDSVVRDAGGAVYPAKDARMSARTFRAGFPGLERFASFVDPNFSSSFWRRVCNLRTMRTGR
jgi:FAD/FMN-containing dehydrogenase